MNEVVDKKDIQKHYSWVYSVVAQELLSLQEALEDWQRLEDAQMIEFFNRHIQNMEHMRDYLRGKTSQ